MLRRAVGRLMAELNTINAGLITPITIMLSMMPHKVRIGLYLVTFVHDIETHLLDKLNCQVAAMRDPHGASQPWDRGSIQPGLKLLFELHLSKPYLARLRRMLHRCHTYLL